MARAAADPEQRSRLDEVIRSTAIPAFQASLSEYGEVGNGWIRPRLVADYGRDYQMRSLTNLIGIWANNAREVICFGANARGAHTQTFPSDALPGSRSRYFWSVTAVDQVQYRVIPNPLERYLLNVQSGVELNADGSLRARRVEYVQ